MKRLTVAALLLVALLLPHGVAADSLVVDSFTAGVSLESGTSHTTSDPSIICYHREASLNDAGFGHLTIGAGSLTIESTTPPGGYRDTMASLHYTANCLDLGLYWLRLQITVVSGSATIEIPSHAWQRTITASGPKTFMIPPRGYSSQFDIYITTHLASTVFLAPIDLIPTSGVNEVDVTLSADSGQSVLLQANSNVAPGGSVIRYAEGANSTTTLTWTGAPGNWVTSVSHQNYTYYQLVLVSRSQYELLPQSTIPHWGAYSNNSSRGWIHFCPEPPGSTPGC